MWACIIRCALVTLTNCLLIICTRHLNIFAICFSYLYQIAHLGDDDEEPEFSSAMPLEEGDTFFFQPRPLKNLVLVDEQENLSPIMSCQVRLASCLCHFHYSKTLIWIAQIKKAREMEVYEFEHNTMITFGKWSLYKAQVRTSTSWFKNVAGFMSLICTSGNLCSKMHIDIVIVLP